MVKAGPQKDKKVKCWQFSEFHNSHVTRQNYVRTNEISCYVQWEPRTKSVIWLAVNKINSWFALYVKFCWNPKWSEIHAFHLPNFPLVWSPVKKRHKAFAYYNNNEIRRYMKSLWDNIVGIHKIYKDKTEKQNKDNFLRKTTFCKTNKKGKEKQFQILKNIIMFPNWKHMVHLQAAQRTLNNFSARNKI